VDRGDENTKMEKTEGQNNNLRRDFNNPRRNSNGIITVIVVNFLTQTDILRLLTDKRKRKRLPFTKDRFVMSGGFTAKLKYCSCVSGYDIEICCCYSLLLLLLL
jgi:hypothetical protein